ncbi:hypothetical protein BOVMAS03_09790 [Streptococcus uberis]
MLFLLGTKHVLLRVIGRAVAALLNKFFYLRKGNIGIMEQRNKYLKIRVSEKEKKILERKARKSGVTVSEFIRATSIHSDDSQIRLIDVKPLRQFVFELTKQGTNLNQFMKFLHTYGIERISARHIKELLEDEKNIFERGKNMLIGLQKELERHNIYLVEEKKNNDDY